MARCLAVWLPLLPFILLEMLVWPVVFARTGPVGFMFGSQATLSRSDFSMDIG
jgi:hypothetical protein